MNLGGNNLHNNAVENGSIGRGNHGYLLLVFCLDSYSLSFLKKMNMNYLMNEDNMKQ